MSLAPHASRPVTEELKALEDYWRSKMRGEMLPSRRDIDAWDLRAQIAHLFFITVTRNPLRFWFRDAGAGLVQGYGKELAGKYIDELAAADERVHVLEDYRTAVIEARPVCNRLVHVREDGDRVRYERLLLPLSSDGETVDMLLGGAFAIQDRD